MPVYRIGYFVGSLSSTSITAFCPRRSSARRRRTSPGQPAGLAVAVQPRAWQTSRVLAARFIV
jgi:hypothetical protein